MIIQVGVNDLSEGQVWGFSTIAHHSMAWDRCGWKHTTASGR